MGVGFYIAVAVAIVSVIGITVSLIFMVKNGSSDNMIRITFIGDNGIRETKEFASVLKIGRGNDNDLIVSNKHVSGNHCRIVERGGELFMEDLNSTNGTMVNGRRIATPELIKNGDTIHLGETRFVINF